MNMKISKIFQNKKAVSDYVLWWLVFKIGFTIAVCFVSILIVNGGYNNVNFGSRAIDARLIGNTLLHSKVLMKYDSAIDRVYAANIDSDKWQNLSLLETELNTALSTGNVDYVAMNITLIQASSEKYIYYNKDKYLQWNTFYEGSFRKGSGGYVKEVMLFPVTYGVNYNPAFLKVEVLIPYG
jgi:hypothetical protein